MDLKQLTYFVRVADLGSFTRASTVLNVAQPALSRQVRQLEVEIGHNLLLRNGRGVTVTESGKLLLEHGRGILHQVERAYEDMGRVRGALAGRVAVGIAPSIAKRMMVPLARAFHKRLPNATLSITEALSSAMLESLASGRLDIALLYNPPSTSDIESVVLMEEDLYLISAAVPDANTKPIPLREVARFPLVIPTLPNTIRLQAETEFANIGCHPQVALEIDGIAAILDLVADGIGHAMMPQDAVATAARPQAFTTRHIVEPRLRSRLAVVTSARRPATLTQQAMLGLIRELAAVILVPAHAGDEGVSPVPDGDSQSYQ